MNSKIFNWIFFIIIILVVVAILIKNWSWIKSVFSGSKNTKCSDIDSPIECIKKMGAVYFETPQEGYAYGDYQFYSNGRVFQVSTKRKGSFDKEKITWDGNGETITIKEIFKN